MTIDPTTPDAHVFLHIGTMKTGTSYLQQVLGRNTDVLAGDGAIYVAAGAPTTRGAIKEALGKRGGASPDGPWSRLAGIARDHHGSKSIISNELISFADDEQAQKIVASFRPNPVTVIITARDLARLLPSAWQNKVKHGRAWPYARYVNSVISDEGPKGASRSFWHHHDLAAIVDRWVAAAGADHVVVIPVPRRDAGPDALWERFASVVGLNESGYDLTQDRRSNLSLGYAETELLRHVNRRLHDHEDWSRHAKVVQRLLANEVLRPDPSKPVANERPQLTPAQHEWTIEKSRELADHVAGSGVRVLGSLDELVPDPMSEEEQRAAIASVPPETPEMFIDVVSALVVKLVDASNAANTEDASGDAGGGPDVEDDDWAEVLEHEERAEGAGRTAPEPERRRGGRRGGRAGARATNRARRIETPDGVA